MLRYDRVYFTARLQGMYQELTRERRPFAGFVVFSKKKFPPFELRSHLKNYIICFKSEKNISLFFLVFFTANKML